MMYIANNELIKTDKRKKVSKITSTNTSVIAVMIIGDETALF